MFLCRSCAEKNCNKNPSTYLLASVAHCEMCKNMKEGFEIAPFLLKDSDIKVKKKPVSKPKFEVVINGKVRPNVDTLYVRFLDAKVSNTKEVQPEKVMVDYNEDQELVGLEIIAPKTN